MIGINIDGMKKILGVLPARLNSTRLPRKMLADINGKPLIYWSWLQATKAKLLDKAVIATDSKEIFDVVTGFGAEAMMTPEYIQSGSDRVAYAAKQFKEFIPEIVVNIQGDEPLMPPEAIDLSVETLLNDAEAVVATPATPFPKGLDLQSPNFVKVVTDLQGNALYFSRSIIPFPRDPFEKYLKHLGLYAFRKEFLDKYVALEQTPLEKAEKLEQLRILENGYKIKVVVGDFKTLEVNTPEELEGVRRIFTERK